MTDDPCVTGHYPVDIHIRNRGTVRICVICGYEEPKEDQDD